MLKGLSKPMQYLVIGGLVIIVYLLISPVLFPETPRKSSKKPVAKKSSRRNTQIYTAEDMNASFDPVSVPLKNVFKPGVAKAVKSPGTAAQINSLPPAFAGGEANWVYTGTAEVDGVLQALVENKSTGDSVFLKVGDEWKGIYVEQITDDSLVLSSAATGTDYTLSLPVEDTGGPPSNSINPANANPGMSGPIGPLTIQPDPSMIQGMPDGGAAIGGFGNANAGRNGNNGGRRRGRRG